MWAVVAWPPIQVLCTSHGFQCIGESDDMKNISLWQWPRPLWVHHLEVTENATSCTPRVSATLRTQWCANPTYALHRLGILKACPVPTVKICRQFEKTGCSGNWSMVTIPSRSRFSVITHQRHPEPAMSFRESGSFVHCFSRKNLHFVPHGARVFVWILALPTILSITTRGESK